MRGLLLCLLFILTAACWGADGECRILFAGNFARGPVEQMREAVTQVAALRAQAETDGVPAVVLSPGNLLKADPAAEAQHQTALAQAVALQPAAIALGPEEVTLGVVVKEPSLPWLSVNPPKKWPAISSTQLTVGRLRIGVIGLSLAPGEMPEKALQTRLDRAAAKLRKRSDVVVLLGVFDATQAPMLTAMNENIDIVLGGTGETQPQEYGAKMLAPINPDAPYYGQLDLAVRDGKLVAWRGWVKKTAPVLLLRTGR